MNTNCQVWLPSQSIHACPITKRVKGTVMNTIKNIQHNNEYNTHLIETPPAPQKQNTHTDPQHHKSKTHTLTSSTTKETVTYIHSCKEVWRCINSFNTCFAFAPGLGLGKRATLRVRELHNTGCWNVLVVVQKVRKVKVIFFCCTVYCRLVYKRNYIMEV
jgi:hypothetical protein